jgi:hypothetical protein
VRAESQPCPALDYLPTEKRTAIHGVLEPVFVFLGDVDIEVDLNKRFLLAGKLAHL